MQLAVMTKRADEMFTGLKKVTLVVARNNNDLP
jgi:hypothetical protein